MSEAVGKNQITFPVIKVDVVETGMVAKNGWLRCEIGQNLQFKTDILESYCFAQWDPIHYDMLLLAAAVEFCDRTQLRPSLGWAREIHFRMPVHDLDRWNKKEVKEALDDVLSMLTGDIWGINFFNRKHKIPSPQQGRFNLPGDVSAVIPYSDGMDSRAVAGIMEKKMGKSLIRVRLGPKGPGNKTALQQKAPFTSIPYALMEGEKKFRESSVRSRGFKFMLISGLAAYLSKAKVVIVPESGQGALGPSLVPVGQAHEDYRNHPLFTKRMEGFFDKILNYKVVYDFPRLWNTKGETLEEYLSVVGGQAPWVDTWSCWMDNRHVSVNGKKRQCGICAACMLRRLSVFAAGQTEFRESYVWEDLSASTFENGASQAFDKRKITRAFRDYAVAGTLHLDHLASLRHTPEDRRTLKLRASQLGTSVGMTMEDSLKGLDRLLLKHESEWREFMSSLGPTSFVAVWATQN